MMTARRTAFLLLLTLTVVFAVNGCDRAAPTGSRGALAPSGDKAVLGTAGAGGGQGFFPLEIGNRWHYEETLSIQMIEGGVPQPPEIHMGTLTAELTQMETLFGREYMVEERRTLLPGLAVDDQTWYRHRQDRSGLYEADVSINQPPAGSVAAATARMPLTIPNTVLMHADRPGVLKGWVELWLQYERVRASANTPYVPGAAAPNPPGGALVDELIRLAYPLRPRATWDVREVPLFTSTVEAREVLDTAVGKLPAWRIRMDSPIFGPNDVGLMWYGRQGLIRMFVHVEGEILDPAGNPIGLFILETDDILDGLDLGGPGGRGSRGPSRPGDAVSGM